MATHQLSSSHLIYAMSAGNRPALRVHSGDRVVIETADCFENQIRSESQDGGLDWVDQPATGPNLRRGGRTRGHSRRSH
ncbi:MAG: hypothetical protein IMX06_08775 [Kyrpidia tusciae]|nr:hypothetical protein [Kyrpidia tusciae]MBE3552936.1 hypothetical protein [Kyrpidia tusciae]